MAYLIYHNMIGGGYLVDSDYDWCWSVEYLGKAVNCSGLCAVKPSLRFPDVTKILLKVTSMTLLMRLSRTGELQLTCPTFGHLCHSHQHSLTWLHIIFYFSRSTPNNHDQDRSKQSLGISDQNWTVAEENGIAVGGGFAFSLNLQQTSRWPNIPGRIHFVAKIQFVKNHLSVISTQFATSPVPLVEL